MAEPLGNPDEVQARLERAEEQDDEARLQALQSLHAELEAELETDGGRTEPTPPR